MTTNKETFLRFFISILISLSIIAPVALAQDETDEDTLEVPFWEAELTSKLSASQAGYQNWAKGGVNTLAFSTGIDGKVTRTAINWEQEHELRLGFGLVKQDTLEFRKADDEIRLTSSLQYKGDGFYRLFNPTVAMQTRTQFAEGFNYKKNPFDDGREPPVKVSAFFSPATFTQSVGLTYDPAKWFTQRLGIGAKETVVYIERFRRLYGVDSEKLMRFEMGIESRTNLDREIFENVHLKSTLGLFAAFNKPDLPDLLWENVLTMKVNSWLGVNFEFVSLYDRDINERIQLKEVLSLGFTFAII